MLLSMKEIVLVVGGGIAGMETAVQLKSLGLVPVIVEKSSSLGGHVAQWNRLFPDMTPANKVLEPYDEALKEVDIYTDTEIASMNYLQKEYVVVLSNGKNLRCKAVVFATGFKLFEAEKKEEYGYGIYDRVITNRDLENWFNTRSDERVPVKPAAIGFVHCVGSRDVKAGNSQCSKVCCITAIKQAIEMKEEFRSTMLSEIQNEALNSALDQWMEEGNIVYTEAGEDWKLTDPAPAASEEAPAEETDAAAEETANP